MSTQKQIAEKAGVHQSLVSMALKNHPHVSLETREKIQKIAEDMGYRPNAALSEAASNRWRQPQGVRRETVAFLTTTRRPIDENISVIDAAGRQLDTLGYQMQSLNPLDYPSEKNLSEILYHRGIRGVIIEQQREDDRPRALHWERFVVVQAGMLAKNLNIHQVTLDFQGLINEATLRVIEAGYKRICFLLAEPTRYYSDALLFQAAQGLCLHNHLGAAKIMVCNFHYDILDGDIILKSIRKFKPDILLFPPSIYLKNLLTALDIPKVALIGDHASEDLPGFASQFELLGKYTADLLDSRMRAHDYGIPKRPHRITFIPPWKEEVKLQRRHAAVLSR